MMALAVDQLLTLILQANNTGALCLLRETQTNTASQPFQQLILDLATALNSQEWSKQLYDEEKRLLRRKKTMKIEDVHRCSNLVLNYIITLISEQQGAHSEAIWAEIFRSPLAKQISVGGEMKIDPHCSVVLSLFV